MGVGKTNILFAAVVFCVVVMASLYATHTVPPSGSAVAVGAFLYLEIWILTLEYAYAAAASLYRFRRPYLILFFLQPKPGLTGFRLSLSRMLERRRQISGLETACSCAVSYLFMVYGFALGYMFVSRADDGAFNVRDIDIFASTYFSMVTAATVGYGDIAPLSVTARSLVMAEIVVSLLYAVFFFSVLASAVRDGGPQQATADPDAIADERVKNDPPPSDRACG